MIPWYFALTLPPLGAVLAMLTINFITWYQNRIKDKL